MMFFVSCSVTVRCSFVSASFSGSSARSPQVMYCRPSCIMLAHSICPPSQSQLVLSLSSHSSPASCRRAAPAGSTPYRSARRLIAQNKAVSFAVLKDGEVPPMFFFRRVLKLNPALLQLFVGLLQIVASVGH